MQYPLRAGLSWIQWVSLVLTIVTGIWTLGRYIGKIEQVQEDNAKQIQQLELDLNELRANVMALGRSGH